MKYQIADQANGGFGEIYNTREEADAALADAIEDGQALNDAHAQELGIEPESAADFFEVIEVQEFEYEWNDYVIGYVVTHIESGRTANMQFDYSLAAPHQAGWSFDCEGDETGAAFTDDEKDRALEDAQYDENMLALRQRLKDIYSSQELRDELEKFCAMGDGVSTRAIHRIGVGMTYRNGSWYEPA